MKIDLTIPEEMVCIWKKRTRRRLPSRGSQFDTTFFFTFWNKKRPIPRRVAISKGFNDHYHWEGPNPKNHILFLFLLFEKKIRPIL